MRLIKYIFLILYAKLYIKNHILCLTLLKHEITQHFLILITLGNVCIA